MDKWDKRFIEMAELISNWSSCCRAHVGCVIVRGNRVLTTGYNGAPVGIVPCRDKGYCYKNSVGITRGNNHCFAIHAEQNALMQAAKLGISIEGATLYCTHKPCDVCTKLIINAGIKRVVYINDYDDDWADELVSMVDIEFVKYIKEDTKNDN